MQRATPRRNAQTEIDPNGVVTTRTFNFRNQVTEERILVDPEDEEEDIVTEFHYDDVGNLERVRLPNCAAVDEVTCPFTFEYVYDGVNRLLEVHDAEGGEIHYSYDLAGNKKREEYTDGPTSISKFTNFRYDSMNRLRYVFFANELEPADPDEDPASPFHKYIYDADGTLLIETDPEGHTTSYAFDALKRLKEVSSQVGSEPITTFYTYDHQDNLESVTDPNELVTTYTNSDFGWKLSAESPDTGTTTYEYDLAGNLEETLDANGTTVRRTYDDLSRLTKVEFFDDEDEEDESLEVTYSYDSEAAAITNGIGRRTGMIDASGSSTFSYDARGLMTKETRTSGGQTFATDYTYDRTGNLIELAYPAIGSSSQRGRAIYHYDDANRVDLVEVEVNGEVETVADTIAYKPFGPRTQLTFGSDLVDTRSFDTRYRLGTWTLGTSGALLNYTHTFDDDGNMTGRTDNNTAANTRSFGYDEIHRLVYANGPWRTGATYEPTCGSGSKTYTYDKNGNRLCESESESAETNYDYVTGANWLESTTVGAVTTDYLYDDNGNAVDDESHTYEYSLANRLATVDDGATATYFMTETIGGRSRLREAPQRTSSTTPPAGSFRSTSPR
jgi:YD repeat-containing protein